MQVTGRDGVARVIYVTIKGRRRHLIGTSRTATTTAMFLTARLTSQSSVES